MPSDPRRLPARSRRHPLRRRRRHSRRRRRHWRAFGRRRTPFRLVTNTTSRSRRDAGGAARRLRPRGVGAEEIVTATLAGAELIRAAGLRPRRAVRPGRRARGHARGSSSCGGTSDRPPRRGGRRRRRRPGRPLDLRAAAGGVRAPHGRRGAGRPLARPVLPAGRAAGPRCGAVRRRAGVRGRAPRPPSRASPARPSSAPPSARLGLAADRAVAMVGDDLWSDVQGAQRAGLQGWLVRTGKFREDVLARQRDHARPHPRQRRRPALITVVSLRPP